MNDLVLASLVKAVHKLGRLFRPLIDLIFALFEEDHCRKSYESERNGRHLPKEYEQ